MYKKYEPDAYADTLAGFTTFIIAASLNAPLMVALGVGAGTTSLCLGIDYGIDKFHTARENKKMRLEITKE